MFDNFSVMSRAEVRYLIRISKESSSMVIPLRLNFLNADFFTNPAKSDFKIAGSITQSSTAISSIFCG